MNGSTPEHAKAERSPLTLHDAGRMANCDPVGMTIAIVGWVVMALGVAFFMLNVLDVLWDGQDGRTLRPWYNTKANEWIGPTTSESAQLGIAMSVTVGAAFAGLLLVGLGRLISFSRATVTTGLQTVDGLRYLVRIAEEAE